MTEIKHMRLIIDLEKCDQCESCSVSCDYHDRAHSAEHGISGLRERATFALICRRCAQASCVEACVFHALERDQEGVLKRHNMRCVSCKMCAHACPFGTIYPETLTFYQVNCEICLEHGDTQPGCVSSCPQCALEFRPTDSSEKDIYIIDQHLAARAARWHRQEVAS